MQSTPELTQEEHERYSRQLLLSELSLPKQLLLKHSKILIIGAGGLGSPCLTYLTGAGIGTIGIIDDDSVSLSNLHRQVIHTSNSTNINKAISAKHFLSSLNPFTVINTYPYALTRSNAVSIIKEYDLAIACCDNPQTRYLINDVCALLNKPFISGSSVRWDGQLSVHVKDAQGNKVACYRCIHPNVPNDDMVAKAKDVGVIGTAPGVIGTLQANEAIKFVIGENEGLLCGKMLMYDGLDMKIKVVRLRGCREECIVCGKEEYRKVRINENNEIDVDDDK